MRIKENKEKKSNKLENKNFEDLKSKQTNKQIFNNFKLPFKRIEQCFVWPILKF